MTSKNPSFGCARGETFFRPMNPPFVTHIRRPRNQLPIITCDDAICVVVFPLRKVIEMRKASIGTSVQLAPMFGGGGSPRVRAMSPPETISRCSGEHRANAISPLTTTSDSVRVVDDPHSSPRLIIARMFPKLQLLPRDQAHAWQIPLCPAVMDLMSS